MLAGLLTASTPFCLFPHRQTSEGRKMRNLSTDRLAKPNRICQTYVIGHISRGNRSVTRGPAAHRMTGSRARGRRMGNVQELALHKEGV